jgi:hypothetical protein
MPAYVSITKSMLLKCSSNRCNKYKVVKLNVQGFGFSFLNIDIPASRKITPHDHANK